MKIKPEELRIGNYVYDDVSKISKIESIESEFYNRWNGSDEFTMKFILNGVIMEGDTFGIPLNDIMLTKLGFNKIDFRWEYDNWLPYLIERNLFATSAKWFQVFNVADCNLVYVHELQNLYFILTGKELNFIL